MRKFLLCLLLLPSVALGQTIQTFTYPNTYGLWNPFDSRIKYAQFAALVSDADVEISRVAVPTIIQTSFTLKFPAQAVAVTVAKVKTGFTQSGTTAGVVNLVGGWSATYTLSPPFTVPAGATTTVVYDPFSWSIVATVTTPAPPPPPVVPPAPPGISPVGSTAVPGQTLLTAQGAWSFDLVNMGSGGNVLLLNGAPAGGSGVKYAVTAAGLKVLNTAGQWWLWTGSVWTASTAP